MVLMDDDRTRPQITSSRTVERERTRDADSSWQSRYAKRLVEYQRISNEYLNRDKQTIAIARNDGTRVRSLHGSFGKRQLMSHHRSLPASERHNRRVRRNEFADYHRYDRGDLQQTNQFPGVCPTTLKGRRACKLLFRPIRITGQLSAPEDAPPSGERHI